MAPSRFLVVALLTTALAAAAVPGVAQTQVDEAARDSGTARREAEDAAAVRLAAQAALLDGLAAYEGVNRDLEDLGRRLAAQRTELMEMEDEVRELRSQAQALAVAAYMSGGDLDVGEIFGDGLRLESIVARHLAATASDVNRHRIAALAASREELAARRAAFERDEEQVRALRSDVAALVATLGDLLADAGYQLEDSIAAVAEADRRYRLEVVRFEEEQRRLAALGGVAQWRPLVERYFPAHLVTDALRIMHCESRGNPDATNPTSDAAGLFQFLAGTWAFASVQAGFPGASRYDPEANVAAAAWLVDFSVRTGHPYGTWGRWACRSML